MEKILKEDFKKINDKFNFVEVIDSPEFEKFTYSDLIKFQKDNGLQSESILNCIIQYCEKYDLDVVEIGESIKRDKKFIQIFKQDLLKNHEAVFNSDSKKQNFISEWI